jgi:hypothetical protein
MFEKNVEEWIEFETSDNKKLAKTRGSIHGSGTETIVSIIRNIFKKLLISFFDLFICIF